ncbi:OmpA family protein [Salinispirillum sp. LH 10-3-1]|uniref:OmpA family protein n=1 Tax=Salinispirillum sp. LH 10-3-1 TaxID=2952525 RepID=A0AB38YCE0_9GAMM
MNGSQASIIGAIAAIALGSVAGYFYYAGEQYKTERDQLRQSNQMLSLNQQQAVREQDDLRNRVVTLESRLSQTDAQRTAAIRELEQQLAQAQQELEATRQTLAQVRADYERTSAMGSDADALLSSLREELAAAREQAAAQEAKIEEQRAALEEQQQQVSQLASRLNEEQQALDELQSTLELLDSERQQLVERLDSGTTIIKLPERVLFASGSAELNEDSVATLREVVRALGSFPDYRISVLGHTDSRTITRELAVLYPTNWELSAARATAAVREMIRMGAPRDRMRAVGMADTQPLAAEVDEATRRQNRRIEIVLEPPLSVVPL